jgi:hypothetical protein
MLDMEIDVAKKRLAAATRFLAAWKEAKATAEETMIVANTNVEMKALATRMFNSASRNVEAARVELENSWKCLKDVEKRGEEKERMQHFSNYNNENGYYHVKKTASSSTLGDTRFVESSKNVIIVDEEEDDVINKTILTTPSVANCEHCLQSNYSFQSNDNSITKDDDDDDGWKTDCPTALSTSSTTSASVAMLTENLSTISMVMTAPSLLEKQSSSTETMSDEFTTTMSDEDEVVWKTTKYDQGLLTTSSTMSASSAATPNDEKNIISSASSTEMLCDTDEEKEKAEYLGRIIPNISLSYSDYHLDTFVFM